MYMSKKRIVKSAAVILMCLIMVAAMCSFPAHADDDEFYHTDLILDKNNLVMPMGSTETLVPGFSWQVVNQEVFWASTNEAVASVDSNGVVTAHSIGTATISCQLTEGSNYDLCRVQVRFKDVPLSGEYYSTPVYWAYRRGYTKGYTGGEYDKCFGVGLNCDRKDMLIFLWRNAGKPYYPEDARDMYNDVSAYGFSTSANRAIAWATWAGIVKGYSDGGFHPTDPIERKDIMIILYRFAGRLDVSGTMKFTDCQDFNKESDTYKSILWGSQNKITNGYSSGPYAGMFGVNLHCLREQMITFLYRYDKLMNI